MRESGRGDTVVVSARDFDGRDARGGVGPDWGAGRGGPVAQRGEPAEAGMVGRVPRLAETRTGRRLGVSVGGRHPQRSARGRGALVRPGGDRRERPRGEAFSGDRGRRPGVDAKLAGSAAGHEEPGSGEAAEAGGGRRGAGVLVGAVGGVSGNAEPALLDAQDGQRAELSAEVEPAEGEGGPARDLAGGDPGAGRARVRSLACALPGQVSEGRRLSGKGPEGVAGLLRFPGQALGAPAHDQRDRIGVRDDPAPQFAHQRLRHTEDDVVNDIQDGDERRAILEAAARLPATRPGHRGSTVQGRQTSNQ